MRLNPAPGDRPTGPTARRPAVAGSFYPADRSALTGLVDGLLAGAEPTPAAVVAAQAGLTGILVPHAGLVYSGHVAAAAWRVAAASPVADRPTIVLLGTNHGASWLHGVGVWDRGSWTTPLGEVEIDEDLATTIAALGPPFVVDRDAHRAEHSLEVQLPFVTAALPTARIVPLAVSSGVGERAVDAGERLGELLSQRRADGAAALLAISTDMAHYPSARDASRVTAALLPSILAAEPRALGRREAGIVDAGIPGVVCGMCGIEPAVLGLAALRAMRAMPGQRLAAGTSADVGGPPDHAVGYLAVAYPG